MLIFFIRRKVL